MSSYPRLIAQIAATDTALYALADDGTLWVIHRHSAPWVRIGGLPDGNDTPSPQGNDNADNRPA